MLQYFCENVSPEEITEKSLSETTQIFKNLRILAMNIISSLSKLRETSSYLALGSKYDIEKLGKEFTFDRNYLIKMKNDLDFLQTSVLSMYYNFSSGSDPFLIALSEKTEE